MSKNALSLHVKEIEKSILYPGADTGQFKNIVDWSLAEGLSFL